MSALFWSGLVVGAICGLVHAVSVYRGISHIHATGGFSWRGIFYAVWTTALWLLFGTYVVALWIIACVFYIPSRLLGRPSTVLPFRAALTDTNNRLAPSVRPSSAVNERQDVRRVAIIGAGVSGLATARSLIAQELDCTVFERGDALGGVWADGYLNFGVQVQRELYEYPDWPLAKGVPNFTPGPAVQKYLSGYADHFDISPRIRFNSSVFKLDELANAPGWRVSYRTPSGDKSEDFDFVVVARGLYSETPNIPEFFARDAFSGTVVHISELKSAQQLRGKRVVVVGYGKSAADAAVESAAVAKETKLIFRHAYWPVPRNLLGILPFKWGMLGRLTSTLIPMYWRPSALERGVHSFGRPLVWFWWRLVELLLRFQCRLGSRFGTRVNLVPEVPIEIGCFSEPTMLPRPAFFRLIRKGKIDARKGGVSRFAPTGVVLNTGEELNADVVVLATGWKVEYGLFSKEIRSRLQIGDDGLYLYRHILHPDVPRLAFIGNASTISSILTYSVQARWLSELLAARISLPSADTMRQEIKLVRDWKRRWMPESDQQGARLLLHMLHYHDDLLQDIGCDPLRKKGFFAPLKELLAPYQPGDYRDVAAGGPKSPKSSIAVTGEADSSINVAVTLAK